MKRIIFLIIGFVVVTGIAWGGIFYWKNLRGAGPAWRAPGGDIAELLTPPPQEGRSAVLHVPPSGGQAPALHDGEGGNTTGMPLKLPPGFSIEVFAKDLPGARVMALDHNANLWVTQTSQNKITQLFVGNGKSGRQEYTRFGEGKDFRRPHGIVFNRNKLYLAEEDRVSIILLETEQSESRTIINLPTGGHHTTRTLGFGPDGRLYVSIGSSCNVCNEKDPRRAAIYVVDIENKKLIPYASGLRNSVFFTWSYVDGKMWATEMGRDMLGDDLPPDEINIVALPPPLTPPRAGGEKVVPDFGWPICYGKNIHDSVFDKNQYIRDPCADRVPSYIDLPAHSAPLGLAFIPEEGWPEEYWYDLLVAFHGSWNRSEPTGYKVVRFPLNSQGQPEGEPEDFISGWLQKDGTALGRPVDIIAQPGGVLYISDDKAGVIYKATYSHL